jgi:hypothetical protein
MGAIVGLLLKRAAEGGFGSVVKSIYWAVAGSKTLVAILLAFCAGVVKLAISTGLCGHFGIAEQCAVVDASVGNASLWIASGLALLGQVDGAMRLAPPQK